MSECKYCKEDNTDHDYEHIARHCYPVVLKRLESIYRNGTCSEAHQDTELDTLRTRIKELEGEREQAVSYNRMLNDVICGNCSNEGMIKTPDYCNVCEGGSMFSDKHKAERDRYRDALEELEGERDNAIGAYETCAKICADKITDNKRYRDALENIIKHQEVIGGTMGRMSGTYAIASKALKESQ